MRKGRSSSVLSDLLTKILNLIRKQTLSLYAVKDDHDPDNNSQLDHSNCSNSHSRENVNISSNNNKKSGSKSSSSRSLEIKAMVKILEQSYDLIPRVTTTIGSNYEQQQEEEQCDGEDIWIDEYFKKLEKLLRNLYAFLMVENIIEMDSRTSYTLKVMFKDIKTINDHLTMKMDGYRETRSSLRFVQFQDDNSSICSCSRSISSLLPPTRVYIEEPDSEAKLDPRVECLANMACSSRDNLFVVLMERAVFASSSDLVRKRNYKPMDRVSLSKMMKSRSSKSNFEISSNRSSITVVSGQRGCGKSVLAALFLLSTKKVRTTYNYGIAFVDVRLRQSLSTKILYHIYMDIIEQLSLSFSYGLHKLRDELDSAINDNDECGLDQLHKIVSADFIHRNILICLDNLNDPSIIKYFRFGFSNDRRCALLITSDQFPDIKVDGDSDPISRVEIDLFQKGNINAYIYDKSHNYIQSPSDELERLLSITCSIKAGYFIMIVVHMMEALKSCSKLFDGSITKAVDFFWKICESSLKSSAWLSRTGNETLLTKECSFFPVLDLCFDLFFAALDSDALLLSKMCFATLCTAHTISNDNYQYRKKMTSAEALSYIEASLESLPHDKILDILSNVPFELRITLNATKSSIKNNCRKFFPRLTRWFYQSFIKFGSLYEIKGDSKNPNQIFCHVRHDTFQALSEEWIRKGKFNILIAPRISKNTSIDDFDQYSIDNKSYAVSSFRSCTFSYFLSIFCYGQQQKLHQNPVSANAVESKSTGTPEKLEKTNECEYIEAQPQLLAYKSESKRKDSNWTTTTSTTTVDMIGSSSSDTSKSSQTIVEHNYKFPTDPAEFAKQILLGKKKKEKLVKGI